MTDHNDVAKLTPNPLQGFAASSSTTAHHLPNTPTIISRAKAWAWRASASYIWLAFIAILFGEYDRVHRMSNTGITLMIDVLARIGFSPTDPSYFALVLKVGWILAITGFSLIEIGGFLFYVLGFPLGLVLVLVLGRVAKASLTAASGTSATGKAASKSRRVPLLSIAVVGLLGWFLLYGDASSLRVIAPGVIFAGLLFVVLFYRFFRRVRPIAEEEAALLGRLEVWGFSMLEAAGKYTPSAKSDVAVYRWLFGWVRRIYRRLAILVRGRRGRDRISIYVLLEYALSAILLGVTAVVFWGMVIKCALAPRPVAMNDAVQIASSHFIPGLPSSSGVVRPPFWVSVGTGATAWVLFVIVLAPAGSVLPSRQAAHANRLARTYKVFRITSRLSARFLRWLDRTETRRVPAATPV
jgi:hypothetical protein